LSVARSYPIFLWGASTSSYQVEGGITNNDWDFFTRSDSIKKRIASLTKPNLEREIYQYNMSKMILLEQRIREKIQQTKDEMFPGHNRIYLEALKIEIDTLNWVLNEIVSSSQDTAPKKRQR